jgi:hypothetical protein
MPRRLCLFFLAFVCAFGTIPVRASGLAPADEYFGPFKESILEIRNRLMSFERDSNSDLAHRVRAVDNLELAIEDWYRHYPRDPWIPGFAVRLAHVYERANAPHNRRFGSVRRIAMIAGSRKRSTAYADR